MEGDDGMAEKVAKGMGVVRKDNFKVVGINKADHDHYEFTGDSGRGKGRPSVDRNWRIVGSGPSGEDQNSD